MRGGQRWTLVRAGRTSWRALVVLGGVVVAVVLGAGMLGQLAGTVDARSAVGQLWSQHKEQLGSPRGSESCGDGICAQRFQRGRIFWSEQTGAHIVRDDAIGQRFHGLGAVAVMGLPVDEAREAGPGRLQEFQRGGIFARDGADEVVVQDRMWFAWLRTRASGEDMGFPVASEEIEESGARVQRFERGAIYVRHGTALAVRDEIAVALEADGGTAGPLGYPLAEERTSGDGRVQRFEGGAVWWSPATGAVPVHQDLLPAYAARRAEKGELGFPTAVPSMVPGGTRQTFEHGTLYRAEADGSVRQTSGEIQARYEELGGAGGELGLPTGERTALGEGTYQTFTGGVVMSSARAGTWAVGRAAFDAFVAVPSRFGWPTANWRKDERGVHTAFERVETIERDGVLYSAEPVDSSTAVLICDSQCDGNSWVEQGVAANGFGTVVERAFGGGGYAAASGRLGMSVTEGIASHRVLLPEGDPGLVVITLGGNDASQRRSDAEILDGMRRTVEMVRQAYPDTRIVIDGVMSRRDPGHARRRAVEALILDEARRLGLVAVPVAGWITDYGAPQGDDVHLTQAGHDRVAGPYAEALRSALAGH